MSDDRKDERLAEGTLISHLLELRDRFFRMAISLVIVFIPAFIYRNDIFDFLAAPVVKAGGKLITTTVVSPFATPLKVAFYFSLFLAMPYILSQIWGFVSPGLYKRKSASRFRCWCHRSRCSTPEWRSPTSWCSRRYFRSSTA